MLSSIRIYFGAANSLDTFVQVSHVQKTDSATIRSDRIDNGRHKIPYFGESKDGETSFCGWQGEHCHSVLSLNA